MNLADKLLRHKYVVSFFHDERKVVMYVVSDKRDVPGGILLNTSQINLAKKYDSLEEANIQLKKIQDKTMSRVDKL